MYIDKPMQGHNLMQAIARVNRVYKDKPGGLIVDYIGIGYFLKYALSKYSSQQSRGNTGIPIEEVLEVMQTYYEIVSDMFFGFNYSVFYNGSPLQRLQLLPAAMEHILQLKGGDGKKRFLDNLAALNKAFSLATPHEEALAIRDDLAFFQAVRAGFVKVTTPSGRRKEDIDHAIRQLISRAVISDEVINIFEAAGLPNPEISILSEKFLKEVEGLEHKNLAVELLNKLLNDQIKSRAKKNLVQSRSFAELLQKAIIKYQNRTIEAAKILEELLELAREIQKAQSRGEELGLSDNEIAFYDALTTNKSAVEIMGDETLKKIAKELVQEVRKSATIDFTVKASVQAKMRVIIRRLLKKYKYPPDQRPEAIRLIMEQAQLFGEEWAVATI
jgi:type I restriction enzyme R subunit